MNRYEPRTRVFFATDAGGVGLNLQRAANACIHLDLPWNPAVMEQRSGRIYRLGQTSPVDTYALVTSSGIESRIASIVGSKKAFFDGLFDGVSDEVQFEKGGSFMASLQALVDPVVVPELPVAGDDDDGQDDGAAVSPAALEVPEERNNTTLPATDFISGISVQQMADGRMVLEAKPEAAQAFAAMLEGVAALLKQFSPKGGQA